MQVKQIVRVKPGECAGLVDVREAAVYLGYGEQMPDDNMQGELRRCADTLIRTMRPRYMFTPVRLVREEGTQKADFGEERLVLPGKAIAGHLGSGELAVAACLTLGEQVDGLIDTLQKESMLDALLTDALANAAVERLRMRLEQDAKETLGLAVGWLFGIGYGDFPLAVQHDFVRCMRAGEGIGLSVNAQGILSPLKSVTGFLDVADGGQQAKNHCNGRCSTCPQHENCRFFRKTCSKK